MRVGSHVKGSFSPFVHGKIISILGKFATLDSGGVYFLGSLQKSTKKENKILPDFIETLKKSKNGLNF